MMGPAVGLIWPSAENLSLCGSSTRQVDAVGPIRVAKGGDRTFQESVCRVFGSGLSSSLTSRRHRNVSVEIRAIEWNGSNPPLRIALRRPQALMPPEIPCVPKPIGHQDKRTVRRPRPCMALRSTQDCANQSRHQLIFTFLLQNSLASC